MDSTSPLLSRRKKWIPSVLEIVLLTVMGTGFAVAQVATGNISGYIRDSSGAVVPNATVTAKMVEQDAVRTTKTDAEGFYSLLSLPPGQYEMTFEVTGFQKQIQTGLQLTVGQNLRVDGTLQVGSVQNEVTVGAQAPLVDTTAATLSGLIDDHAFRIYPSMAGT